MKNWVVLLLVAIPAVGCSPSTVQTQPLPAGSQDQINQNLQNGRLPQPSEVKAGTIPLAGNACSTFRASLPASWQQGTLSVPEDLGQPQGTQINIFYYGRINPNSTPIVYFNGGPCEDSHSDYGWLTRLQRTFDPGDQISFIFIDQRGNGCSDSYPQGHDAATLKRLSHYGSREIAADAEAVHGKLWPGKSWIVAGQSYGGFITHRYVTLYPQSLKAAFSQEEVLTTDGYSRIRNRIESQVRVDETFLAQYPDDRQRIADLRDYLTPDKCFQSSDKTRSVCGFRVLFPLVTGLLGFTDHWLTIHQWVGTMVTEDGISDEGIGRFLNSFYFNSSNPLNIKAYADSVISWVDRNVPPLDAYHCERIRADLKSQKIDLDTAPLHECMVALQDPIPNPVDTSAWLHSLPQDMLSITSFVSALAENSALQFYLYSGAKDIYVPAEDFGEELAALKLSTNAHYTAFQSTGHDASFEEPQSWVDMQKASAP